MSELGLFLVCTVGALLCIGILLYFLTGPTSYDVVYEYEYIPDKNRVYSIKTKKFYRFKIEENYEYAVTQTVRRNLTACSLDPNLKPLIIKAAGRGSRQFCCMDRYGFPRTKNFFGFKTGDMVKVTIPEGAKTKVPVGVYIGRIAVRSSGSFDVKTKDTKITVPHKYCKLIHLMDGYSYV